MPRQSFLSGLNADQTQELLRTGRPLSRGAGDTILAETDAGDRWIGVIRAGSCRVLGRREDGTCAYLAARHRGDIIGEMAAVREAGRSATVVAVTPVTLHVISEARFHQMLDTHPQITRLLLSDTMDRLHEADRNGSDLASAGTESRVTRLLVRLAEAEGVTGEGRHPTTTINGVRRADLAEWCGVSPKSVQRRINRLVETGVLARGSEKCQVVIRDLTELTRIAARRDDDHDIGERVSPDIAPRRIPGIPRGRTDESGMFRRS